MQHVARFESWGNLMTYQALDVSDDPTAQGFSNGTYDVVVVMRFPQLSNFVFAFSKKAGEMSV
jgi:hypothetical protein